MTTSAEIENHIEISERFLRHAEEQFEEDDLPQASEKAWGAVAHYLKSVAKFRGWQNRTHWDLTDIADDLALETDNPDRAIELYISANQMHQNFYEDSLSPSMVGKGIRNAREFISLMESRTGTQPAFRPSQVSSARRRR